MGIRLETTSNRGGFKLFRSDKLVYSLKSNKWPSHYAATEYNNQKIELKSKSVFQNSFHILKNENIVGEILMHWFQSIRINLTRADGTGSDNFTLMRSGLFTIKYDLWASKKKLLTVTSKFRWFDFKYQYLVEEHAHDYPEDVLNELLIYAGYAASLNHAKSHSG